MLLGGKKKKLQNSMENVTYKFMFLADCVTYSQICVKKRIKVEHTAHIFSKI